LGLYLRHYMVLIPNMMVIIHLCLLEVTVVKGEEQDQADRIPLHASIEYSQREKSSYISVFGANRSEEQMSMWRNPLEGEAIDSSVILGRRVQVQDGMDR